MEPIIYLVMSLNVPLRLVFIAKNTKEFDFPDKKLIDKIYTHKLSQLLKVVDVHVDERIQINWSIVTDWSEQDRYKGHLKRKQKFYEAVANSKEGVLEWLKQHW